MRKLAMMMAFVLMAAPAMGDFFSPGEPNGWDPTTPMTDAGGGIWEYTWTGYVDADGRTLFDILAISGDWNSKVHPSGNQWTTPDASDGNTLSLDTNTYADGWSPTTMRVGVATEDQGSWTAVGDWQDQVGGGNWDNGNPNTLMTDDGGGIYSLGSAVLTPGNYNYKSVVTGTWDSIGGNSRNVNSDNFPFTTDAVNDTAEFLVNVLDGTIRVNVTPEPATLALLGLGAAVLVRRRR